MSLLMVSLISLLLCPQHNQWFSVFVFIRLPMELFVKLVSSCTDVPFLSLGVGGSCVSLQEVCANVSHLFLCVMSGGVIFLLLHLVLNLVDTVGTGPISSRRLYSQCLIQFFNMLDQFGCYGVQL